MWNIGHAENFLHDMFNIYSIYSTLSIFLSIRIACQGTTIAKAICELPRRRGTLLFFLPSIHRQVVKSSRFIYNRETNMLRVTVMLRPMSTNSQIEKVIEPGSFLI